MMMFQKNARFVLKMKITKDTIIGECLAEYPKTAEVLFESGIHCVGCFAANVETIEIGLKSHGLSEEDIEKILVKLNKVANEE